MFESSFFVLFFNLILGFLFSLGLCLIWCKQNMDRVTQWFKLHFFILCVLFPQLFHLCYFDVAVACIGIISKSDSIFLLKRSETKRYETKFNSEAYSADDHKDQTDFAILSRDARWAHRVADRKKNKRFCCDSFIHCSFFPILLLSSLLLHLHNEINKWCFRVCTRKFCVYENVYMRAFAIELQRLKDPMLGCCGSII